MNFEKCSIRQRFWVVRHIVRSTHLPSADSRSTDSPSVTLFSTKSGYTVNNVGHKRGIGDRGRDDEETLWPSFCRLHNVIGL